MKLSEIALNRMYETYDQVVQSKKTRNVLMFFFLSSFVVISKIEKCIKLLKHF